MSCWVLQLLGQPGCRRGTRSCSASTCWKWSRPAPACGFRRHRRLAYAYVVLVRRVWWEKGLLLLMALPIAIVANVLRVVATGLLFQDCRRAIRLKKFSHDAAGWATILLAAALFALVLWYLDRLWQEVEVLEVGAIARRVRGDWERNRRLTTMFEKKLVLKRIDAPRRLVPVLRGPGGAAARRGAQGRRVPQRPKFPVPCGAAMVEDRLADRHSAGRGRRGCLVAPFVPQYEAQALLEIADQPQYVAFEPRGGGERSKTYFLTQMQLIQSPWIMGRVVVQSAVAELPEIRTQPDPIVWLSKRVKVGPLGDSDAFTIAYTSGYLHAAAWWSTR